MATKYAAEASDALADIQEAGAVVAFTTATPRVYDPDLGTFTGGVESTVSGWAIQKRDDPAKFAAMGLVIANPVTLYVAAWGLGVTPTPNMAMLWAGVLYTVRAVEALAPDGTPITYTVIGSRT